MAQHLSHSLLSTRKTNPTGLKAMLHPLALLAISYYLTTHSWNGSGGPVAGILLGRQDGREISIEQAFECHATRVDGQLVLHEELLMERLQQYKEVHVSPALELVAWYTTCQNSGPTFEILQAHNLILRINDTALLLTFHPSQATSSQNAGRLPINIYETVDENEGPAVLDEKGPTPDETVRHQSSKRLIPVHYAIEAADAETIAVDYVSSGSGNATKTTDTSSPRALNGAEDTSHKLEGPNPPLWSGTRRDSDDNEDLIASMNTRGNATSMLESRIRLLREYCNEYHGSKSSSKQSPPKTTDGLDPADESIMRAINNVVLKLDAISGMAGDGLKEELIWEEGNATTTELLHLSLAEAQKLRELTSKFAIVDIERASSKDSRSAGPGGSQPRPAGVAKSSRLDHPHASSQGGRKVGKQR